MEDSTLLQEITKKIVKVLINRPIKKIIELIYIY